MIGAGALVLLILVVACLCRRYRRKNSAKNGHDSEYYTNGTSELSLLNQISPYLRRDIEKSLLKDPGNFQAHKEIGSGNFGKVYSGQFVNSVKTKPMHVAVKTVKGKVKLLQ